MIHRALFGPIERFFAILVEHYAGAFPAWLAPVQVTVAAGRRPPRRLRATRSSTRCAPTASASRCVDAHADTLGARIRRAKLEKVPYVLVVGDDDVEHGTVGVNARGSDEPERGVALDDFVDRLAADVDEPRAHVRDASTACGRAGARLHRRASRPRRSARRRRLPVRAARSRPIPTEALVARAATTTRSR